MPLLQTSSIKLNRLWIGDHWLMADKDTLFKIRVTPPLTLAKASEKKSTLLSNEIKTTDSLPITIRYADRINRIEWYAGSEINIFKYKDRFACTHETKNPKR